MSWNEKRRSRTVAALGALAAAAAMTAALAAPARAAVGSGEAAIVVANHSKGRTLSGQGVKLLAADGASSAGGKLSLPIAELDPGAQATANSAGSLRFKYGKRAVSLTGIHFNLVTGTLDGKLGDSEIAVFKLGAAATVNTTAGSISLKEGGLRLTADAAAALKKKLGLKRALVRRGVGMIWLSAQASPARAAAQAVTSGSLNWGVLASWRQYVLGNFGPGSIGTITTSGGATSTGTLTESGAFFSFPSASGSYQKGLYGAADKLSLNTAGSVTFAKPGHCIIEIKFSAIDVKIDGADSSITLDSISDIDTPAGMTCTPVPAVTTAAVQFAKLNLSGITATSSADGKTVTWTAIPASLTAAGSAAWGAGYPDGQVLDPVSISVGLG